MYLTVFNLSISKVVIPLSYSILYVLLWSFLLLFLLVATIFDLKTKTVPNFTVYVGGIAGLLLHGYYQGLPSMFSFLMQSVVVIMLSLLALRYFPLGGADWKGFVMITCYCGFMGFVIVFGFSLLVQGAVYFIRFFRGNMNLEIVYLPAMLIGAIAFLAFQHVT